MLTGDSLFVGDIARPDLAVDKAEGAHGIFHSLHDQLLSLPDTLRGLAGASRRLDVRRARHGPEGVVDDRVRAGEPAAAPDRRRGRLRATGHLGSRRAAAELPEHRRAQPRPARDGDGRRPPADAAPGAAGRGGGGAHRGRAHRASVRRGAHPSAVCITARRGGFGTRLAWLADPGQPLVLVGRDDEDAREAGELAGAVGLTQHRRLPRRRHDLLARGEAAGRACASG